MGFSTFPNNPFPPSTAQFDEGKNEAIQSEIDAIKDGTNIDSFADVESALATKTNISNIAPDFDATSGVYVVGDKVIYEGVLYEFTSAHSTAGEWDESEVQPVKVSELIDSLKSGLTSVETLQTITPDALFNGDITIKRNCGVKFVLCHNMILKNDLAVGATVELCAAGTVLNPPTEDTIFQLYAKASGNDIAPVNLVLKTDGSIIVINFASVPTKIYGYCCGAYI